MPGLFKASSKACPFALLSPVTICAFLRNSRILQVRPDLLPSLSELRGGVTALVGRGEISDLFEISSLFLMSLGEPDLIGFFTSSSLFTYERLQEKFVGLSYLCPYECIYFVLNLNQCPTKESRLIVTICFKFFLRRMLS